uniref:Uncharacterized protein n=1 Tax=Oryza meridionalis TaxID=40149 RepID=A0A0E0DBZ8_9ORYZ
MWGLLRRRSPSGFSPSSTAEEVTAGIDGSGLEMVLADVSKGAAGADTRGPPVSGTRAPGVKYMLNDSDKHRLLE